MIRRAGGGEGGGRSGWGASVGSGAGVSVGSGVGVSVGSAEGVGAGVVVALGGAGEGVAVDGGAVDVTVDALNAALLCVAEVAVMGPALPITEVAQPVRLRAAPASKRVTARQA
jgi:hypothetical protein